MVGMTVFINQYTIKDNLNGNILAGLNPHGVPKSLKNTTYPFKYNDIDKFNELIKKHGDDMAT